MNNLAHQTKQITTPSVARKEKDTPFFQPKLTINQPDDVYEQEADAVADKVMQMPMNSKPFFSPKPLSISTVQRKCKECEEEEKMQRKEMLEDDSVLQRKSFNHLFIQTKCAACEEEENGMQRKESKTTSIPEATNTVYQVLQT